MNEREISMAETRSTIIKKTLYCNGKGKHSQFIHAEIGVSAEGYSLYVNGKSYTLGETPINRVYIECKQCSELVEVQIDIPFPYH